METELLTLVTQSGVAGLIALLWMLERRSSVARDKQIGEAHDRIIEQKLQIEQLLRVISDNTRAITSLEAAQRALGSAFGGTHRGSGTTE